MKTSDRSRSILLAATAAVGVLGCDASVVDLGSNLRRDAGPAPYDAGSGGSGGGVTSNCPTVTEAQIQALYGAPCDSTCADAFGTPRDIHSDAELVAVTIGRWQTCAGDTPWAADVVGIEFQPGCTLFLLHDGPDGGVVRGIDPSDQGTFNVIDTRSRTAITRSLQLFFPSWTLAARVTTSDCPHRMQLLPDDAGAIELAAIPTSAPPAQ